MVRYLSGRTRTTDSNRLTDDRYEYLSLSDAEPNLGDPVAPGDVLPAGLQYQIISIEGYPGERYWVPRGGGIIPGSISVYDEGLLVGGINSTTQLNFVGNGIEAIGSNTGVPNPGIGITIAFTPPGVDGQVLYKDSGDFATSSGLTFDAGEEYLGIGGSISVGADGSIFNASSNNSGIVSVGINTARPSHTLDINGDVRIRGTIVDFNGNEGTPSQLLTKNNFGGLTWIDSGSLPSAAGGYYRTVQFHNNVGLVDGALEFVYNDVQGSVGIGSTIPKTGKRLDVLGDSLFTGNIEIVGVLTATDLESTNLGVSGIATAQELTVFGGAGFEDIDARHGDYTGIVTAAKFIGDIDVVDLFVTGIATFNNIGATGIITTNQLQVYNNATVSNLTATGTVNIQDFLNVQSLRVTGVSTLGNIKVENSTLSTNGGNIIINSGGGGILQVIDPLYVDDNTESTSSGTGSIITLGGVGIAKNLNVDGEVKLATNGGITTTGGDLYVDGDLYVTDDVFYDELNANRGEFVEYLQTDDFYVTGVSTFLGNVYMDGREIGISTFIDNKTVWDLRNNDPSTHDTSSVVSLSAASAFVWNNEDVSGINTTLTITGWWDDNAYIDNRSADGKIIFRTGFTEGGAQQSIPDLLIDSTGNIGIGTDTASTKMQIAGDVTPSEDSVYDLGQPGLRWNTVYASTLNGTLTGTADNSNTVLTTTSNVNSSLYLTFVESDNSPGAFEQVFTDVDLAYNPFTNTLSGSNALFTNQFTVEGNSSFGNATTDTVAFTASLSSDFIPNQDDVRDLGSNLFRYSEVHAVDFFGNVNGTASNANNILTEESTTNSTFYLTFVDSNNSPANFEAVKTTAELSYNPGTQELVNSGSIISGSGSGGVALTVNDGYGDANITFNHKDGIPEQGGNAARIQVNTDAFGSAYIDFGVKSNVTASVAVTPDYVMRISENVVRPFGDAVIDFGTSSLRWKDVYAENFIGNVTGTTDSANEVRVTASTSNAAHYITFVDSNNASPGESEEVFSDTNLQYNPSTNILTTTNLLVTNNFDVNGNTDIGNAASDLVSFNATVNTNFVPNVTSTVDIGTNLLKWRTIYADTFDGTFSGTADSAEQILTSSSDTNQNFFLTFVDSNNVTPDFEDVYTDANITYNPNTNTLSASNLSISTLLSVQGNTNLGDTISDEIAFNGSLTTNILPNADNTLDLGSSTRRFANVYANQFNGAFAGTADSANEILTQQNGADSEFFLTFVDSNNASPGQNESLFTDSNITYNPNDNALTIPNINVSGELSVIGNTTLGSDTLDYVIINGGVQSNVIPFTDSTYNIGSDVIRFATIYADAFNGTFQGTADGSLQILTQSNSTDSSFYLTFVENNNSSPGALEDVYTDLSITYNPSTNTLLSSNISVSTLLNVNGNTDLGNDSNDTVTFTASIDSDFNPSADSTYNMGTNLNRWATIYADTFNGAFQGTADTADQISLQDITTDASFYLTFVDQSADAYKSVYQDAGITYNPATNILTTNNITVSTLATFNGNTILGNEVGDTITFGGRVNSNVLPDADNTHDLGSVGLKWSTVYADTFNGTFQGTASSSTQVLVTDNSGAFTYGMLFTQGNNASPGNQRSLYTDAEITYNPSTNLLQTTNITTTGFLYSQGNAVFGQASTDTVLFSSTINSNFIPTTSGSFDLGSSSLKWGTVYANSFNGVFQGTADVAEQVNIGTNQTDTDFYLTFVSENNSPPAAETIYTDSQIRYNPFNNTLQVSNLDVTADLEVLGNTIIGNTTGDTLSIVSTVTSNFVPNVDVTYDLGSSSLKWGTVYADTFNGAFQGNADTADQILIGTNGTDADLYLTFSLDSNDGAPDYESLYADSGLRYNPFTNLLTTENLTVTSTTTLGNASNDLINLVGSVNTNIIPWQNTTFNLGSATNRWNTVYATTFDGTFQGTASQTDRILTEESITGSSHFLTFVDSNNTTGSYELVYTSSGVSYNPGTEVLSATSIEADTYVSAGVGSGDVSLTVNDGDGNANVTFNHRSRTPDQAGNSARIFTNVDATSGAYLGFGVKSNVSANTIQSITRIASVTEDGFMPWTDSTYDLGSTVAAWDNIYVNSINGTAINGGGGIGGFESGTRMIFQQSTAPTGWTIDATYDNYAIRIVDGSVAVSNRTTNLDFTSAFANRTVPLPRHQHTGTSDDSDTEHTHTGTTNNQNASHAHGGSTGNDAPDHAHAVGGIPSGSVEYGNRGGNAASNNRTTIGTGGANLRHVHGFGTGLQSSNHAHTFTTSGDSQPHSHTFDSSFQGVTGATIDMRVNYVDFILAQKT